MSTQMHEFLQNRSRDQGLLQLQDSAIAEVHPAVEERKRAPFGCPQVSLGLLKVKGEETREGGGGIGLNMLLLWGLDLVLPSQSV